MLQTCQQIWKTQSWPQEWKKLVFSLLPEKCNAKECSNYCAVGLSSHASEVSLKVLQTSLQYYMDQEFPGVKAGLEKAEKPEVKL